MKPVPPSQVEMQKLLAIACERALDLSTSIHTPAEAADYARDYFLSQHSPMKTFLLFMIWLQLYFITTDLLAIAQNISHLHP